MKRKKIYELYIPKNSNAKICNVVIYNEDIFFDFNEQSIRLNTSKGYVFKKTKNLFSIYEANR